MVDEVLLDFDFSQFQIDESEQKHIPSDRKVSRIFLGYISFRIDQADFSASDCLLDMTSQMISILERMLFLGSEQETYAYIETAYYVGFVRDGSSVRVSGSEKMDSVFTDETTVAKCELLDLASAFGAFHKRGILEAVKRYPGLLSRRDFLDNCKFVDELLHY